MLSLLVGLIVSASAFTILSLIFCRSSVIRFAKSLSRPFLFLGIIAWALLMTAAVTQINLATQVTGLLPGTNGGTGVSSTATYPASGTIMITTTGVTASQLPNPTASTLGGVESLDCTGSGHIVKISTSGVPTCAA